MKKRLIPLILVAVICIPIFVGICYFVIETVIKWFQTLGIFELIVATVIVVGVGIMILRGARSRQFAVKTIGVEVYWNKRYSKKVTNINWGSRRPRTVKKRTIYIRNEGVTDCTLALKTKNWAPRSASQHIFLDWNAEGKRLSPSEVVEATLTLNVSPRIREITNFSFNIVITGKRCLLQRN